MDKELLVNKLQAAANDLLNAADEITNRGLTKIGFYTDDGNFDEFGKNKMNSEI